MIGGKREPGLGGPLGAGLPAPTPGGDTQNTGAPAAPAPGSPTVSDILGQRQPPPAPSQPQGPGPSVVTPAASPPPSPTPRPRPNMAPVPDPLASGVPQVKPTSSTEMSTFARTGERRFQPFQGSIFGQGANPALRRAFQTASSGALGRSVGEAMQAGDLSRALIGGGGGGGGTTAGDVMGASGDELQSLFLKQLGLGG